MIQRVSRSLFFLFDGLVLILFVVGYLARYIHPRHAWAAGLIATGLIYLTLALLACTVFVALSRRWKLLALHVALVVLAAIRFMPFDGSAAAEGETLTILTYNTSRGGGARADELGQAILELVQEERPDLAAFQEAAIEFHLTAPIVRPRLPLAALIDSLGYTTIGPRADSVTFTHQPVIGHVELLEQSRTILPNSTPEEETMEVTRTHFSWQGREAVHYNLHLRSFGTQKPWEDEAADPFSWSFWASYLRQYRHAYLIRACDTERIRALLNQETLPLIVSGDFNSTPHNWTFHHLAQGLQDAFQVAGTGWGATYHARLPFVRIDHVLVSPEWEVAAAHVSQAPISDHLPLTVKLRWRE